MNAGTADAAQFEPTRWSVVLRARAEESAVRRRALEELGRAYWPPLYAFLRRSGRGTEDAEDIVQELFVRLMDGTLLANAHPARGKLRTLLLAALRQVDADAWRRAGAQKRGGGKELVRLDTRAAEAWVVADSAPDASPEEMFDRTWATAVMDRAWARVRLDYGTPERAALFAELAPRLSGETNGTLAAAGQRLGLGEDAAKKALSRLRRRLAEALRAEVAETVGSRGEVQDELRHLLSLFS